MQICKLFRQMISKHSEWIYSSAHDEMLSIPKGHISLCLLKGMHDHTDDITLRCYKMLFNSHIIATTNINQCYKLMRNLLHKQPSIITNTTDNNKDQIIPIKQQLQYQYNTQTTLEYQRQIDLSNQIQMYNEMNIKDKNQKNDQQILMKQQNYETIKYLQNREKKQNIQRIKIQSGIPKIIQIEQIYQQLQWLYNNNCNVTFLINELQIQICHKLIKTLQNSKYRYEIIPMGNLIINAIAASGLPADRFAFEYHPNLNNINDILQSRKRIKMSLIVLLKTKQLEFFINKARIIYGKQHIVYLHRKQSYRGTIQNINQFLIQSKYNQIYDIIVIAPYLSQFNQDLKEQQNKIKHIYGQAQSSKINLVELKFLESELKKIQYKKNNFNIDVYAMAAELLSRISQKQKVWEILKKSVLISDQQQLQHILKEGGKRLTTDIIGLKQISIKND